jgi:hypothetical protein
LVQHFNEVRDKEEEEEDRERWTYIPSPTPLPESWPILNVTFWNSIPSERRRFDSDSAYIVKVFILRKEHLLSTWHEDILVLNFGKSGEMHTHDDRASVILIQDNGRKGSRREERQQGRRCHTHTFAEKRRDQTM